MKQTKLFSMIFACLLLGISYTTVSAQSSKLSSQPQQGSGDAVKQQKFLAAEKARTQKALTPAQLEQQKLERHPIGSGKIIPSGKTNLQVRTGQAQFSPPAADRKQRLLELRAAAAAKGHPTAKYDLELQKLNN